MNRVAGVLPLLVLLGVLEGCAARPVPRRAAFNEAEFQPYAGSGTSTIQGQAFLKTRGGEVRFGAGNTVYMVPATSFTREWYDRAVVGGVNLGAADPEAQSRIAQYERRTTADGNGNFEFRNIPAGEYFITCNIVWEVPYSTGYTVQTTQTGGTAHAAVKVGPGETVKAVVTR